MQCKYSLLFLLLPLAGLVAGETEPQPAYWWNVNEAKSQDGAIAVPEKITGADLVVPTDMGVSIVDSTDMAGGKSLAFDGTQPKACASVEKIHSDVGMRVSFRLNLDGTEREKAHAIFQAPGISIYAAREGPLHCSVRSQGGPDGAASTEVVLPAARGTWVEVSASVKGSEIEFQIDGKSILGQLPEGAVFEPAEGKLSIGGTADNGGLIGEIADIKIFLSPK